MTNMKFTHQCLLALAIIIAFACGWNTSEAKRPLDKELVQYIAR